MAIINLFLMDMTHAENTSGVDRYLEILLEGLKQYPAIHVYWIHLLHDNTILFHKQEQKDHYIKITIPLPQQFNEIIAESFWIQKYNEYVFHLIRHQFENKDNCILHLHTLNLIHFALYIKAQCSCKIIIHLHCIPWKGLYNSNRAKFNDLYKLVYLNPKQKDVTPELFATNNCELQSYHQADHVICVTQCAKNFLHYIIQKTENDAIDVIPNGMHDYYTDHSVKTDKNRIDSIQLIYVGVLTESKGLFYILKAMRKVQRKGYNLSLTIAGKYTSYQYNRIKNEYSDLTLNIVGHVPFERLKTLYMESDIGIIASLQEQASYVAVEMAMFGLPVITTAVDGLDETFTNDVNALKINTKFSAVTGLSVDVDMMANAIITLIDNQEKRIQLGINARKLYKEKLSLKEMISQTVSVYKKVGGIDL